jgi:hypothetical protein
MKTDKALENDGAKLREYCQLLYDNLNEAAEIDPEHGPIWNGLLTNFVVQCGIPRGWYTLVINQLYEMRCLERIQTGTRYQPTVLRIIVSPAEVPWKKIPRKDLTTASRFGSLWQAVEDLRKQTGGLNIVEVFRAFEERLDDMQDKLDGMERALNGKTKKG